MLNKSFSDYLIDLVKGLSTAEKKNFRLFVNRNVKDRELKFLELFEFIDKTKNVNEEIIRKNFSQLNRYQLYDLKAYVYEQLLISLRLTNRKGIEFKIREQIDWASILYSKGLDQQGLSQLRKLKVFAEQMHKDALRLEILELEKQIEFKVPTAKSHELIDNLLAETSILRKSLMVDAAWSDLSLKVLATYSKIGNAKNREQILEIKNFFETEKNKINAEASSFFGKLQMYQAHAWHNYICQDFKKCFLYASKWVDLFEQEPLFKKLETELYLKGVNVLLGALFYCEDHDRFIKIFNQLKKFVCENQLYFVEIEEHRAFNIIEFCQLNLFLVEGKFEEGIKHIKAFIERWNNKPNFQYDILIFNFKVASMYFGMADFKNAIRHLNTIINRPDDSLREDVQSFSRILFLLSHFELGNRDLMEYQLESVSKFLVNLKENQKIQMLIIEFLKKNLYSDKKQLNTAFIDLRTDLLKILSDPFERRSMFYLDLVSWVESKIENRPLAEIMNAKFISKQRKSLAL